MTPERMEAEFSKFILELPEQELIDDRTILLMKTAWFSSATTLLKYQRSV